MSKPTKPKKQKAKKQKAIITITDEGTGKITLSISFKPMIKGDAPMTPAVAAAIECMQIITKRCD